MKMPSQRSLVKLMATLDAVGSDNAVMLPRRGRYVRSKAAHEQFWSRTLFENEFPAQFFISGGNKIDEVHDFSDFQIEGVSENILHALTGLALVMHPTEDLLRSVEIDGFTLDVEKKKLVSLEGPVSIETEENKH